MASSSAPLNTLYQVKLSIDPIDESEILLLKYYYTAFKTMAYSFLSGRFTGTHIFTKLTYIRFQIYSDFRSEVLFQIQPIHPSIASATVFWLHLRPVSSILGRDAIVLEGSKVRFSAFQDSRNGLIGHESIYMNTIYLSKLMNLYILSNALSVCHFPLIF